MYFIIFALIAVTLFTWLYTNLHPAIYPISHIAWLVSISIVTFLFYWLDKRLSKSKSFNIRIPECLLNMLAIVGGFFGAWIGRFLCEHKTNVRKHPWMFIILILTTVIYCWLAFTFLPPN